MAADSRSCRRILVIEDNPADIRMTIELFADAGSAAEIAVATSGMDALRQLRQTPSPDLVLLDLNLPGLDGREVLRFIRSDPKLQRLPVIVMTTSRSDADIARCYDLHANCYLIKPLEYEEFARLIALIDQFWLRNVVLPPHTP